MGASKGLSRLSLPSRRCHSGAATKGQKEAPPPEGPSQAAAPEERRCRGSTTRARVGDRTRKERGKEGCHLRLSRPERDERPAGSSKSNNVGGGPSEQRRESQRMTAQVLRSEAEAVQQSAFPWKEIRMAPTKATRKIRPKASPKHRQIARPNVSQKGKPKPPPAGSVRFAIPRG